MLCYQVRVMIRVRVMVMAGDMVRIRLMVRVALSGRAWDIDSAVVSSGFHVQRRQLHYEYSG